MHAKELLLKCYEKSKNGHICSLKFWFWFIAKNNGILAYVRETLVSAVKILTKVDPCSKMLVLDKGHIHVEIEASNFFLTVV